MTTEARTHPPRSVIRRSSTPALVLLAVLAAVGIGVDYAAGRVIDVQLALLANGVIRLLLLAGAFWAIASLRRVGESPAGVTAVQLEGGLDRLGAAFECSATGMGLADIDGRWIQVNRSLGELFGYPRQELLATTLRSITHPEDLSVDGDQYQRLVVGQITAYQVEKRFIHRNGSTIWGILSVSAPSGIHGESHFLVVQIQDITARKRHEHTIQESELRYRLMAENSSDMISRHTPAGTYLYASPASRSLLGYEPEELLGHTPYEYIHPEDLGEVEKYHPTLLDIPPGHPLYYRTRRKDGGYVWVETTCQMISDPANHRVQEVIATSRDISERRRMQDSLLRVTKAVESSSDGIGIADANGQFVYLNGAFLDMFGYSAEELNGAGGSAVLHSDQIMAWSVSQIVGSGESWNGELTMVSRDGRCFPVSLRANAIRDRAGKTVGQIGIYSDITERRQAEEQVRKLSEAVEHSPAMVMITDSNGLIEYVNPRFTQTTGYTAEEAIGSTPRLLKSGETSPEIYAHLWGTITRGEDWRGILLNRKKEGELYWASASISPLRSLEGAITHFVAVMEDVTAIKEAESVLREAKEAAEVANQAKSEFLASMSHEIRTPMNAIIGMAELLWETPLTKEQRRYVQVFRSAGANLLSLINDVLDLSKVEAGQLQLEAVDFDLRELIDKTCEVMAVRAHKKGLELISRVKPGVSTRLVGDPARLRQVITNLLGNAIKFTESGEVVLEVATVEVEPPSDPFPEGRCKLLFSVRDTGIGIRADKLGAIFDRFTQADSSVTRKYGGTGLGLAISKQLVELMGGRLWVESELGKGSNFFFTAELELRADNETPGSSRMIDMRGLKVLIIDDNDTSRAFLREMLVEWGATVDEAHEGENGLAQIRRAGDLGVRYDLLLLDWHLPGWEGGELLNRIRLQSVQCGAIVAMVTTDDRNGGPTRIEDIGTASYMVKPIKRSELQDAVVAALGKARSPFETPQVREPSTDGSPTPLRILLVEDSEDNRMLIQAYLKKTPHQIDVAENGEAAVERFTTANYDLVLMDMQMPIMDGYTATRLIREWEREQGVSRTPIVALTAHALAGDAEKSVEAGCDAHLTKPIKKATLLEQIGQHAKRVMV